MDVSWDKSDPVIWFGKATPRGTTITLHLVVELLPDGSGWDWAVWEPAGPRITQRGRKPTARQAVVAAEIIALLWSQLRKDHEMD
jgi:hypothetical protein